jgi:predicted RNase H-like nuclease (RuvC/YqgF family)
VSEAVTVAIVGVIGIVLSALIGGGVAWYVALRKMPKEMRVLSSEEQKNLSDALNNAVAAYNTSLTASNFQKVNLEARIATLEKENEETRTARVERDARIAALEIDHARLQTQIAQWEARYNELEKKYSNSKRAIEILVKALDDAKIPMPQELAVLLGDSITKYKLGGGV